MREYTVDPWNDLHETGFPTTYAPLPVWKPKTWLLRDGWRIYGLVSTTERPGRRAAFAD